MKIINEFKKFAIKGNMIDMAVGIVIGAAFTSVVNSLVADVITPVIGKLTGGADFSNLFWVLGEGEFQTLAEAQTAGAITVNYGLFINALISFLIVAWALFMVIKATNKLKEQEPAPEPTEKKCPECHLRIPISAVRCGHCTTTFSKAS